jgi:DNA-binding GntR family transcriptional regulator
MTIQGQSAASDPIGRNYLHDEVAQRLRALIQSGEMQPRERLNETVLAKRFGISRTPLREAIKILSAEGLLDILPNRGAQVASISLVEIEEVAEVIAGLEATAGELLCKHITEPEIVAIEALHERMRAAYRRNDAPDYFALNQKIHEAMLAAARNETLQGIYANLSSRIQRARFTAHKTPEQWAKAMEDHDRMMELMRARNGVALGQLLRDHVRSKKEVISATFGDHETSFDS